MRTIYVSLLLTIAMTVIAQPQRVRPSNGPAINGEMAIKQASDALAMQRKSLERDIEVLTHLRAADVALTDPMQPTNAVEKAWDEVEKAKQLAPEFNVMQGVIRVERELEDARRSPMSADFGRLRATLRREALGPAARVVGRGALRLQEESLAWMKVQELIATHLRTLSEISSEALRATTTPE